MIPSGYKEDVVYSQIPTNGNGDLSFTRASNGTRVNSAGLVEVVAWNLVQQSETFDNVAWTKNTIVVTANSTIAPNGTTTADTLDDQNSGAFGSIQQTFVFVAGVYTFSIYIKKTSGSLTHYPGLEMCSKGTYLIFNTTTGAYVEDSGTNYTVNVENVGDYWRLSITTSTTGGSQNIGVWPAISSNGTSISSGATGSNIFWGAQLNIGTTAKPYFPTTDRLNVPRLTYQNGGGGCPSLLLEKQSTNLANYSQDFGNAYWSKGGATITANATTSPDGTQDADKIAENTTSTTTHYINKGFTLSATTYTLSVFAKASERKWIFLIATTSADVGAFFDLENGVVGNVSSGYSASIENFGNGWYRCNLTFTATAATWYINYLTATANNTYNYAGTIGSGLFIWGAQLEASSYVTSYIVSTSSSATRVVDDCYKFGISSLIGQSEGTIFLNYTLLNNSTDDITIGITGNNGKIIWFRKNGIQFYGNGTTLLFDASSTGTMGVTYKMAFVYGQSDFRLYINGSLIGSVTSGTFTGTFDDFTFFPVGGVPYTNANKINEMVFFPTKLTNAELASLTTI